MLFRQRNNVFMRRLGEYGYIVDSVTYADRVFDKNGAVFLQALSRAPKTLESIAGEIAPRYTGVDPQTIQNDALEFLRYLEQSGFVVSGADAHELSAKDAAFSYKTSSGQRPAPSFGKRGGKPANSETVLNEYLRAVPTPLFLQIEVLNKCNERCVHCYIPHQDKTKSLDRDALFSIVEQYRDMGGLYLTLSGGECMLHPQFTELVRRAKQLDLAVTVLSNLTRLTDAIIEALQDTSLSRVQASLYSMNPGVHDSITQVPGSFKKTYEAVQRLMEHNIPLQISCPVMRQNKDSYQDVYQFTQDNHLAIGVDYIMSACGDHSAVNLENRVSPDDMRDVIRYVMEHNVIYQELVLNPEFEKIDRQRVGNETFCLAGINSMAITATGDIVPCATWYGNVLGNIGRDSLSAVWNHSAKITSLRNLRKKDLPRCMSCENIKYCGLCMARNANGSPLGDPFAIDAPTCSSAAFFHEAALEWKKKVKNEAAGK